jgi:hypothetical protein
MPPERPTTEACAAVHSEDRRARVEGPSEGRVTQRSARSLEPASDACALWRMPTTFPSSATFGHPLSSAELPEAEDAASCMLDRPRPSFRRRSAKNAAFQGTRMPFTATTREGISVREGIAPSGLRAGSLAHAAHTFSPGWGEVLLKGIASLTVRSPAGP